MSRYVFFRQKEIQKIVYFEQRDLMQNQPNIKSMLQVKSIKCYHTAICTCLVKHEC